MSFAIGSTLSVASLGAAPNSGVLESQLNRYEIQLADWCHCPSRTTPQGAQKIAELQAKADAIKAQLKQADEARPAQRVTETPTVRDSTVQRSSPTAGRLIDVLA